MQDEKKKQERRKELLDNILVYGCVALVLLVLLLMRIIAPEAMPTPKDMAPYLPAILS